MNNKSKTREYEIDIFELLGSVLKQWWLIALVTIVGVCIMFAYTRLFVTPLYQSSVSFYVNNGQRTENKISTSDISAAQSLVDTYIVILKHGTTLDEVVQEAGLDCTPEELARKVTCSAIDETEVFRVTVTDPSPDTAAKVAKSIAKILPDKVSDVIEGSTVRIVRDADVPTHPSSPNLRLNLLKGAAIGFLLSCIYVMIQFILDDRIRDAASFLKEKYDYPILSAIPDLMGESKGYYSYGKET